MQTQDVQEDVSPSVDNSISDVNETPEKDNSQDDPKIERYKQQIEGSKKEALRFKEEKETYERENLISKAFRQVLKDNSSIFDLDEDIAREVVKLMHEDWWSNTDSYEELLESLAPQEEKTEVVDKEKLTAEIRKQIKEEEEAEKAKTLIDEKLSKFDEATKLKYLEEFKEVIWKKKLTPDIAKREIEKIIVYYGKNPDEALANMASNPIKTTKAETAKLPSIDSLKSFGMSDSDIKRLYPDLYPKK